MSSSTMGINFYLFYFAALGALWPYWGPYLKTLGFTETEIGQLVAIIMATKIVAPYLTCNIIIFVNSNKCIITRTTGV